MEAALSPDMLATDLAYYLVRKGVRTFDLFNMFSFKLGASTSVSFRFWSRKHL